MIRSIQRRSLLACVCVAAAVVCAPTMASTDRGTRDEARVLSEAAAAHVDRVGSEQAFKDFGSDAKWRVKDMYVFAQTMDSTMIFHGANPKLVGKNFLEVKDASGKEFNRDMIAAAKKGSGWVRLSVGAPRVEEDRGQDELHRAHQEARGFRGRGHLSLTPPDTFASARPKDLLHVQKLQKPAHCGQGRRGPVPGGLVPADLGCLAPT